MLQEEAVKPRPDNLKKSIGISVALHSLVLSLFLLRTLFFSEPMIDLSQAITVSVGEMPDPQRLPEKARTPEPAPPTPEPDDPAPAETVKEREPEPSAKAEAPPEPEEPRLPPKETPKNETRLEKNKARQKAALNKVRKMSAVEKIRQELNREAASRPRAPAKPRVIAAGTALSGLDRLQADDYLSAVDRNIKQVWTLPQWLMNKPLRAQVLVKFNIQGQIISTQITASSGNSTYDQYCLQAVEKAAPFPRVPDKLSEKFSVDGIVIGFPE